MTKILFHTATSIKIPDLETSAVSEYAIECAVWRMARLYYPSIDIEVELNLGTNYNYLIDGEGRALGRFTVFLD